MKVYKIIDDFVGTSPIAFLCYYEKSRTFAIEISPEIPTNELPIFFSGFAGKGIMSVDMEWSKRWVKERVIPEDRQNLGTILRENKIADYDLMKLLEKACGRSAQDDCALIAAKSSDMPLWFSERQNKKVRMVFALSGYRIIVSFRDGTSRIINLSMRINEDRTFKTLENNRYLFESVRVQPGGNGICWSDWLYISAPELYTEGTAIEISADEIGAIIEREIMDTYAVCSELGCTRQYVDKLVRDGQLPFLQRNGKSRLYYRSDVERLNW